MNIERIFHGVLRQGEVVAYFGKARLVRRVDNKLELRGGTNDDRCAAREWISLFMHEAVLLPPGTSGCAY